MRGTDLVAIRIPCAIQASSLRTLALITVTEESGLRIAAFPSIDKLTGNPYWHILRSELTALDVETVPTAHFSRAWLREARDDIDVLHFHYVQPQYAYHSTQARLLWVLRFARNLLLARRWGFRSVYTLHNLTPTYPLYPRWVDYLGHWVAAQFTDAVIVHCRFARNATAQRFGRRRSVHLVNHPHYVGVYPDTVATAAARRALGLTLDETVLLFFGGVRPNKGLTDLLEAFARVPGASIRLVIAGKPWPPREYVESLQQLAAHDDRVRTWFEFIPGDEVQLFFRAADAVVLPFSSILTSGSTMLAMSFGKAVIVPAMGCLPELITPEVGIVYDPGEDGALASALESATSLDLDVMGKAALRRVGAFGHDRFAAQTMEVYKG